MIDPRAQSIIKTAITADRLEGSELLELRRLFGADFSIDANEADQLFALNAVSDLPDDWADYFVTVINTFVVQQTAPAGYIHDAQAAWLIARIDHDGVTETETELRLLLSCLKGAVQSTDRLENYVIAQVREAVLNGRGVLAGKILTPGTIGEAEVEILRTALYAGGSDGGLRVTRAEAEMLFDLNAATSGRDHHPSWQNLFVRALANHVMMLAASQGPDMAEALRREAWLESRDSMIAAGIRNLNFATLKDAWAEAFGLKKDDDPALVSYVLDAGATREAERITREEGAWLLAALMRDGEIDANEQALLDFLRSESPDIDAILTPLIDRRAA